jgi:ArsR family metal-binding transcriptional regulator
MKERLKNILLQAKGGSRDIDELHKELCDLFSVMPRISYFEDKNGVQFETHYDDVITQINEDGTLTFYVIDSDYERQEITPKYVA